MVILYNYLEEGTIKIGVFCCQAPRRGLRIETEQNGKERLLHGSRAPRRGLRIEIKSFQDNISKPICQAPRRGLRIEIW